MYDALQTPFGLVRFGVAPDHPKIKSVTRVYEKTARHPGFRFFGGVRLGEHVTRAELLERYHAVVYAYGTVTDNRLGIPGEGRPGSHSATDNRRARVATSRLPPPYAALIRRRPSPSSARRRTRRTHTRSDESERQSTPVA